MQTNTLNKDITSTFFVDSENGYNKLRAFWSKSVNSDIKHSLTSTHHLLYAILRGKDWRKGFTKGLQEKGAYPEALDMALGLNYPWKGWSRANALEFFIASGIVVSDIEKKIEDYFERKFPDIMWNAGYVNDDEDQVVFHCSADSGCLKPVMGAE